MSFLILLAIAFALNFAVTIILQLFIDNPYIIQLVTSIVLAFFYSIFFAPKPRLKFFKNLRFYQTFFTMTALFVGLDIIMNMLL